MRLPYILALTIAACALCGCQSPRERCDAAVKLSQDRWHAYVDALEQEQAKAGAAVAAAEKSLKEEWQPRLEKRARKKADSLHGPGSSAWWRAFTAAQDAICADDDACARVRGDLSAASLRRDEMKRRLQAARAALSVLDTPTAPLPAVEDDFERKALLQKAVAAHDKARAECADVQE
ncbi:MAG: hypothetical protein PVI30_01025 [Myxococcales bacterium]